MCNPRRCIIFHVTRQNIGLDVTGLAVQLEDMVASELAIEAADEP